MRQAGGDDAATRVRIVSDRRTQSDRAQTRGNQWTADSSGFHEVSIIENMNMTKQLSESLLAACKAAGIEKPRYIAQDKDEPYVWHYDLKPDTDDTKELDMWAVDNGNATKIHHPPYADDWQDSLLEWVEPQEMLPTVFIPHEGEPLADVLARHPEHVADDTEMVILYNVADTSKMIDDAIRIGYHAHIENGNGFRWSRLDCYRAAWQDALAWKGGASE
jgi:hypothetical protein